jgi:DNA-binding transcriptional regulator GbsR (MarR family)
MAELEETGGKVPARLTEVERQVVDFFVDGVRVLGLPGSVGEIYGLLFISREPLSLDDLVARLEISKGSASQGLRTLRTLGAVREARLPGVRRLHYSAAAELKRLAGGFIREQVRPHLDSGQLKVGRLFETIAVEEDRETREFYDERIGRLDSWMKRARMMLPVIQKVLGQ